MNIEFSQNICYYILLSPLRGNCLTSKTWQVAPTVRFVRLDQNRRKGKKFTQMMGIGEGCSEIVIRQVELQNVLNTPGSRGWSRLRDRTLAVAKNRAKMTFFSGGKKITPQIFFCCIYLLVMPKYWGKQIFTHGRFPEVGEKQKA